VIEKIKYGIFISILLNLALAPSKGQAQAQVEIDSLLSNYSQLTSDSMRFEYSDVIARKYVRINVDSAAYYAQQAMELARGIGDDWYIAKAHFRIGSMNVIHSNMEIGEEQFAKALTYALNSSDGILIAKLYLVLGNINFTSDNFPVALDYYQKCMVLSDSISWAEGSIKSKDTIGAVYFTIGDFENASVYFQKAREMVEKYGANDYLPLLFYTLARIEMQKENYSEVREYASKIIAMADTLKSAEYYVPSSYSLLGIVEFKQHNYTKALEYYKLGLEIITDPNFTYFGPKSVETSLAFFHIGESYFHLQEFQVAEENLLTAYTIAKESGHQKVIGDASKVLSDISERRGDPESALRYFKEFKSSADSILNEESIKNLIKIQMEYEFESRLKEQELLEIHKDIVDQQKKSLYQIIIVSFLLGLIILVLLYFLQLSRAKKAVLSRENLKLDLEFKNRELTSNVLQMLKKNELLIEVSKRLRSSKNGNKLTQTEAIDRVIKTIEFSSKEIGWDEFELRFKEVHSQFYENLNQKYENITPNEQRLCAFLKLNMSTKDISAITFQSEHSIVQARSRLKKKLGINESDRLTSFLNQL
jgi:tetratricopeptide (TPR) repeat protein